MRLRRRRRYSRRRRFGHAHDSPKASWTKEGSEFGAMTRDRSIKPGDTIIVSKKGGKEPHAKIAVSIIVDYGPGDVVVWRVK